MTQQQDEFDDKELSDLLFSSDPLNSVQECILHTTAAVIPPLAYAIGVHVLYPDSNYPLLATLSASIVVSPILYGVSSRVHTSFPDQEGEPLSHRLIRYGIHALAAVPVLAASTAVFTLVAPYISQSVDPLTLVFTQLSSYAVANTVVSQFSSDEDRKKIMFPSFAGLGLAALLYAATTYPTTTVSPSEQIENTYSSPTNPSEFSLITIKEFLFPRRDTVVEVVDAVEEKPTVTYEPKPMFTTWPSGADEKRVNSCFSDRGKTLGGVGTRIHGGLDIRAPWHTEIYVVGDGNVVSVDPIVSGQVVVDHGNGISTEYVHLDTISVEKGQDVIAGEILGLAGCRGKGNRVEWCKHSIGHKNAHLHFNVRDTNVSPHLRDMNGDRTVLEADNVNPLCYLDEAIGFVVSSRSGCDTQGGAYKYCGDYLTPPQLLLDIQQNFGDSIEREAVRVVLKENHDLRVFKTDGDISNYLPTLLSTPADVELYAVYQGMLYATIATESKGTINPNPNAKKGPKGLLQFEAATAYGYELCDNDTCTGRDDRLDPDKAIAAGATYHARLYDRFDDYTFALPFTFASWNTGNALIEYAIKKTGVQDPTWDQVSLVIDERVVGSFLEGNAFDTVEERNAKVAEINAHVARTMGHYDYTALLIVSGKSQARFSPQDSDPR